MRSPSQRNDAVDVAKSKYSAEVVRPHAAFEAVTDAGTPQVACCEPLDEAERGAPARQLGVQGAAIERMSPLGYEQKSSGIDTHTIEMTIEDLLGLARESDGPSYRWSSRCSFENYFGFPLRSLDMSGIEIGYLGDEASRSIEQRKRCIESDLSRIVRSGIDKPHTIRGAWKSLHSRSELRCLLDRYSSGGRNESHLALLASGLPLHDTDGRKRNHFENPPSSWLLATRQALEGLLGKPFGPRDPKLQEDIETLNRAIEKHPPVPQ